MPVIPTTKVAEVWRIEVQGQHRQNTRTYLKNKLKQKRLRGVAQVAPVVKSTCLENIRPLRSSSSTIKKIFLI
jgi:hypothetical protein